MRPRTKWALLALGVLVLALVASWWFWQNAPIQTIHLRDGSTVRLLRITRGTTHRYSPPVWRSWLERLGWVEPYQGAIGGILTTMQPEVRVWLQHRLPHPVQDAESRQKPWAYLVDSQGAYLPVEGRAVVLWNSRERIFAVRLPYLPPSEREVWLEFVDSQERRRIRIPPPYITRPAAPLKPPSLPARVKTADFEFELQRLVISDGGTLIIDGVEYPLRQVEPRSRFFERGKPTTHWRIGRYWLEDPYGNRYNPWAPPPWHYPYWVFCAKVYRAADAPLSPQDVRLSGWVSLQRGTETPVNFSMMRHGVRVDLFGLLSYPGMVIEADAAAPARYHIRSKHEAHMLDSDTLTEIMPSGNALAWRVETKVPVLLVRIPLPPAGNLSYGVSDDGVFLFNDQKIFVSLLDETGRAYPTTVVAYEADFTNTSLLIAFGLDSLPKAGRRVRARVAVHSPHVIQLPISPLSKEQVLEMWRPKSASPGITLPSPRVP